MFYKYKALIPYLIIFFIVCSWPFISYPFTDGDILHWIPIAKEIQLNFNFFTTTNVDQSHGPILAWGTALFSLIAPSSLYGFALFNILIGTLGIFYLFYFALKLTENQKIAEIAAFIGGASLFMVYLSRTPMYDLVAAIMYFILVGYYLVYLKTAKKKYFIYSLLALILGCSSRFSIVLGLTIIFVCLNGFIRKRNFKQLFFEIFSIGAVSFIAVIPWLLSQYNLHGNDFLITFFKDNIYRFIKEPGEGAKAYRDFYTFPIYVFVGLLPFSFLAWASIFKKDFWRNLKTNHLLQELIFGFLPCLLLFSLSGHVKLGRYIAYVFPFIILLISINFNNSDSKDESWYQRSKRGTLITIILILLALLGYAFKFNAEALDAILFSLTLIIVILSQLIIVYLGLVKKQIFNFRNFLLLSITYLILFSVLSYESDKADFLIKINQPIKQIIN